MLMGRHDGSCRFPSEGRMKALQATKIKIVDNPEWTACKSSIPSERKYFWVVRINECPRILSRNSPARVTDSVAE
jgi:hypothetical protein